MPTAWPISSTRSAPTGCCCLHPTIRTGNSTATTRSRRICRTTSLHACASTIRWKPFRDSSSLHEQGSRQEARMNVIDRPVLEQEASAKSRLRIIDCDVHPSLHARSDLNQFLPKRWQEHLKTYGDHLRTPYIGTTPFPRPSPLIARRDAWPPTGGPPGSDLAFMRKQHLDPFEVEFGILQVLDLFIFSQQNLDFGAAIQRAINDWQLANWSSREPRLKASILVGQDDTEAAIAEIERCAKLGQYVQINVSPRANEPLGRHRYWPIYARAEELGLPLGIHVGGYGGHAPTGGGWPSYYAEEHQSNAHSMAAT